MNIQQAKEIKLTDYLSALGHQPKRCNKPTSYYLSPLHAETKPSFKVNFNRNQWYDFALGKGGNIIALAQLLYNTDDVGAALQHIAADMNNPKPTMAKPPIPTQVETDKMDKVTHPRLILPCAYIVSAFTPCGCGHRETLLQGDLVHVQGQAVFWHSLSEYQRWL